jgi:hypothetical protein
MKGGEQVNKKIFIVVSLFLVFLFALTPSIMAYDYRYANMGSDHLTIVDGGPIYGTWNYFYPPSTHSNHLKLYWKNDFGSDLGYMTGFQDFFYKFRINETCRHTGIIGWVMLWIDHVNNDPNTHEYGVQMKMTFNDYTRNIGIGLYDIDNRDAPYMTTTIYDFNIYDVAIGWKVNLANWFFETKNRVLTNDIVVYKINRSTGVCTALIRTGSSHGVSADAKCALMHGVEWNYGVWGSDATWSATSEIRDVGLRPDIADADCYVGVSDIFAASSKYGREIGGTPDFWSDGAWKADVNADGYVGIDDIQYIASKFGSEY